MGQTWSLLRTVGDTCFSNDDCSDDFKCLNHGALTSRTLYCSPKECLRCGDISDCVVNSNNQFLGCSPTPQIQSSSNTFYSSFISNTTFETTLKKARKNFIRINLSRHSNYFDQVSGNVTREGRDWLNELSAELGGPPTAIQFVKKISNIDTLPESSSLVASMPSGMAWNAVHLQSQWHADIETVVDVTPLANTATQLVPVVH